MLVSSSTQTTLSQATVVDLGSLTKTLSGFMSQT